jgi:hypothetical protein
MEISVNLEENWCSGKNETKNAFESSPFKLLEKDTFGCKYAMSGGKILQNLKRQKRELRSSVLEIKKEIDSPFKITFTTPLRHNKPSGMTSKNSQLSSFKSKNSGIKRTPVHLFSGTVFPVSAFEGFSSPYLIKSKKTKPRDHKIPAISPLKNIKIEYTPKNNSSNSDVSDTFQSDPEMTPQNLLKLHPMQNHQETHLEKLVFWRTCFDYKKQEVREQFKGGLFVKDDFASIPDSRQIPQYFSKLPHTSYQIVEKDLEKFQKAFNTLPIFELPKAKVSQELVSTENLISNPGIQDEKKAADKPQFSETKRRGGRLTTVSGKRIKREINLEEEYNPEEEIELVENESEANESDESFSCGNLSKKSKKGKKAKSKKGEHFECKFCSESYKTGQALGGHMSRKHPGKSSEYNYKKNIREMRTFERERLLLAKRKYFDKEFQINYDSHQQSKEGRKELKKIINRTCLKKIKSSITQKEVYEALKLKKEL